MGKLRNKWTRSVMEERESKKGGGGGGSGWEREKGRDTWEREGYVGEGEDTEDERGRRGRGERKEERNMEDGAEKKGGD